MVAAVRIQAFPMKGVVFLIAILNLR